MLLGPNEVCIELDFLLRGLFNPFQFWMVVIELVVAKMHFYDHRVVIVTYLDNVRYCLTLVCW